MNGRMGILIDGLIRRRMNGHQEVDQTDLDQGQQEDEPDEIAM